jgi:hypothetical protein
VQTLVQVVLVLVIAALLLIALIVVLAIQVIELLAESEAGAAEYPGSETESPTLSGNGSLE